jgi:hypothetical protein
MKRSSSAGIKGSNTGSGGSAPIVAMDTTGSDQAMVSCASFVQLDVEAA